ncbi:MAG: 4Fe-4S binding protein [bacterium]|nr:4Fe-4S binding protein [bacterium]
MRRPAPGRNPFIKRRFVQVTSLVLLHSSFAPWAQAKWFCNPVLSCHSCVLAWFACPVGVFVHYSGYHMFPFVAAGTVLLLGALFGRLLCGWVCPFGLIMDWLYKIPSPKFAMPNWTGYIKYIVLIVMVFALPWFLGEQSLYSFCRICPASALQMTVPNLIMGKVTTVSVALVVKLAILVAVLVLAVFSSRSFCKVFCPIGAILAPLNLISFWALKPPVMACRDCGRCDRVCPVSGVPSERIASGIPANRAMECVVCHDCQEACPHGECPSGSDESGPFAVE